MPKSTSTKTTKSAKTALDELLGSSSDSDSDIFALASPKTTKTATPSTASKTNKSQPKPTAKSVSPALKDIQQQQPEGDIDEEMEDSYTVLLPSSWAASGQPPPGDCNLLIQVDPEDAAPLDYEGTSGAIGRFEAGPNGIVLDLKGRQYHGSLLPGPTAMLVALAKGKQLRVEGVTDEFATLVQTQDVMAKLDAIVTGAQMDDGYKVVDENVNRVERSNNNNPKGGATDGELAEGQNDAKGEKGKRGGATTTKRTSKPATKRRRKSTM